MTRFVRRHGTPLFLLTLLGAAVLSFFLWVELVETGGRLGAPLDDSWIHLVFARNIAAGGGFSFNSGVPTAGSTAPLWTLLLTPIMWVSTAPAIVLPFAIGLSAFFYFWTIWLVYGWTTDLTGSRLWGAAAGLGTLAAGRFAWAALSGMEATLFAALTVAALWLYTRRGLTPLFAFLLGLSAQVRPEAHFLLGLAVLDTGLRAISSRRPDSSWPGRLGRALWRPLAVYFALALPYLLFSLATTGEPLPNTFYAKATTAGRFSGRALREAFAYAWGDNPAAVLLIPAGLRPLWRHSRPAVGWLLGLPLVYAFVIESFWHYGRYILPLLPVMMAAAALGLAFLARQVWGKSRSPWLPTAAALLLLVAGASVQFLQWADNLANNVREIQEIDVALGAWVAANTEPEDLIAVDDIGAIGYFSGRRLVDMNGLVSPELWPAVRLPDRPDRSRLLTRLLSESRPDWVVSFPLWRWEIVTNPVVAREIAHVSTGTHTIIFQQDAYVHQIDWPYLQAANPRFPARAVWGEAIRLLGYDRIPAEGGPDTIDLYWQSLAPLDRDFKLFFHLEGEDGEVAAQVDRHPVAGLAPTSVWEPGDIVRDRIALPAGLAPGLYRAVIGFYLEETGMRLLLQDGDDHLPLLTFALE